jgi:hypothetical protein
MLERQALKVRFVLFRVGSFPQRINFNGNNPLGMFPYWRHCRARILLAL